MNRTIFYENEKDLEGLHWIARSFDFGTSLEIVAALHFCRCSIYYIQHRKDIYRQEVKRYVNDTLDAVHQEEFLLKDSMFDPAYWDDYSDTIVDVAEEDIHKFRKSLKKVMDEHGFKDSELVSYIECARVLINLSTIQYDELISQAKSKFGYDYQSRFPQYRLTKISYLWNEVCDRLYKGVSIDLKTPETEAFFDELCNKFANGLYIDQCLKVAGEKNPNFKNVINVKN